MANAIKWSALGTFSTAIAGTSLNALGNGNTALGSEIDNATSARNMYADFQLDVRVVTAPTGPVVCTLIEALDGTNYEDGTAGTPGVIPSKLASFSFPLRAVTTAQRITIRGVPLPPTKFKVHLLNSSGYVFTTSDTESVLSYAAYNEEIQ